MTRVKHAELKVLEDLFEREFGEEINMDIVRSRMRRLRQFYYVLLPLRHLSPWIRNLWNVFILRVNGRFAGFIQLSQLDPDRLHLDFIAIGTAYRGKGLGSYVLRGLFKHFVDPNGYGVILEVRLDNPAYRLYQNIGFVAKSQIIHYERDFKKNEYSALIMRPVFQLATLQNAERAMVYAIYQQSIPGSLKGIVAQERSSFQPSMFARQIGKIKNRMLKNEQREYTVKIKHKIIASVNIKSYAAANYHYVTIYLHPIYELLRKSILKQVIAKLSNQYQNGKISMTIYDDLLSKQHDLEEVGFTKQAAYFFMYRSPQRETSIKYELKADDANDRKIKKRYDLQKKLKN